ncbi:MAG: ECF transporter S component [Tissierellia bacterium]|nr:ECF transporter S component [Tissierellia bacterium]
MRNEKTRKMVIVALLGAISIILTITPLGFIPIGPTNATIMHIPVIIGGIVEGPIVGGIVGLIFGLNSIVNAIIRPTIVSYVMVNPLVSVIPRILIGVASGYVYIAMNKIGDKKAIALSKGLLLFLLGITVFNFAQKQTLILGLAIAVLIVLLIVLFTKMVKLDYSVVVSAITGTMVNSVLVLGMIYILYAERYMASLGMSADMGKTVLFGLMFTNGIPEAIIAVIICSAVVRAIKRVDRR